MAGGRARAAYFLTPSSPADGRRNDDQFCALRQLYRLGLRTRQKRGRPKEALAERNSRYGPARRPAGHADEHHDRRVINATIRSVDDLRDERIIDCAECVRRLRVRERDFLSQQPGNLFRIEDRR
jgi:hypothetical protein